MDVDSPDPPVPDADQEERSCDDEGSTNDNSLCDSEQYLAFLAQHQEESHHVDRDFFMAQVQLDVETPATDKDLVIETNPNLSMSLGGQHFLLLSGNGANSCLISKHAFHIDHVDPLCKAIVKCCKDSYVSRGNPIGTGRAMVVVPNHPPIGICIHEAAIHPNEVSLLSEYQCEKSKG